jgi:programmed cell death protein 10
LERQNLSAAQTLRKALSNSELNHPGITYDFVLGLVHRADLNLDMNESVLRLQGIASDCDGIYFMSIVMCYGIMYVI